MSKASNLQEFLRSKAATAPEAEIDWAAEKAKWLQNIGRLYDLIAKWLGPLAEDGTVRYSKKPITLEEEGIGSYQVDILALSIGRQTVEVRPKGREFEGTEGIVEVRGRRAVRTLIIKHGQWLVVEKTMLLKTFPFNEDSFRDLLQDVMA